MKWLLGLLFIFSLVQTSAFADSVFQRARAETSRIAFDNQGGIAGGGVCWWHSRLQRAFLYLAKFNPTAPRPTLEKARDLLNDLIWERGYVEIPGFPDTKSFTAAFENLIQEQLNIWQVTDGFISQGWILGITGSSSLPPTDMKTRMDQIYAQYTIAHAKNDMLWLLLQLKGVASHASLLESMTPDASGGYRLEMIDSNYPLGIVSYFYKNGDRSLTPFGINGYNDTWVPYVSYARDLTRIHAAISAGTVLR